MKTIGVLTSGGDAPGMNAAIRAVVRTGCESGMKVMGIRRGYKGLIEGDMYEMNLRSVSDIIHRGGTMLYSARCPEFSQSEVQDKAVEVCKEFGLDGIVTIGGDGTFMGARALTLKGVPCIGVPGTIDNDIASTSHTIGYDTALNTIMDMVDRVRDTTESHDRCSVIEVMGRNAGFLALNAGIAVGATCILVPEIDYDIDSYIIERMKRTMATDKHHFIIIVAEGVKGVEVGSLAKYIEEKTGVESRATILGHVQRGGSPSVRDRVLASKMGYHAVQLLKEDIGNRVVAIDHAEVVDYDIIEALNMKKTIDPELYKIANEISI